MILIGRAKHERVIAEAAEHVVDACATDDHIIVIAAKEVIRAGCTSEAVVAREAIHDAGIGAGHGEAVITSGAEVDGDLAIAGENRHLIATGIKHNKVCGGAACSRYL